MKTGQFISEEFKHLFNNRRLLISVIIVLLVPLVYAMIMLSPKWGPYDNLDNLPVAVVNNDTGAISDGERINVGEQLIADLESNNALGWEFVSSAEAERGLENMKYYMTIEVPKDFSQNALTVLDDQPTHPELKFTQNEGLHYMAAQVTNNAVESLKAQLSTKVTETYVRNVFNQLGDVGTGFTDAAKGSKEINQGTKKLGAGTTEILHSLVEKSPDINRLSDGAHELSQGANKMYSSLAVKQPDITKLAGGAQTLNLGTKELLNSLKEKSADITKLKNGASTLEAGTKEINSALVQKEPDIKKLSAGASELNAGSSQLVASLETKSADISQLAGGAGKLHAGTKELNQSLKDKQEDVQRLAKGASELNQGTSQLASQLQAGTKNINKLAAGASELADGAKKADQGAQEVLSGIETAKQGSESLESALKNQLTPGSAQVAAGAEKAREDVKQTVTELTQLKGAVSDLASRHPELKNDPGYQAVLKGLEENLNKANAENGSLAQFDALVTGAKQVSSGLSSDGEFSKGITGLKSGLTQLESGQTQVKAGTNALVAGANEVATGNQLVKDNWAKLSTGADQLNSGANEVATGNQSVASGWNELEKGSSKLATGANEVAAGNQSVKSGWQELTKGAKSLNQGANQVAVGNKTVANGWTELKHGSTALSQGASQVAEGNKTVESGWNQLTNGATKLHSGSEQIKEGNQTVNTGWKELTTGASALSKGSNQVSDGTQTVKTGWTALTDGVSQVDNGVTELDEGSNKLYTALDTGAEKTSALSPEESNIKMFAAPVNLNGEVINSFQFYRDSNAPYILTLALFVGIIAMSFIVPFKKPASLPPSGQSWFLAKVAQLSLLAVAQGLIISIFSLLFLRLQVQSALSLILFSVFVSLTFLMIVLFLVVLAGNIGRFAALAFVVLQLSTTGSALPIQMLPEGLRSLSVFLPFTYSINGFRNIITLGSTSSIWASIGVLFIYFTLFAGLSLLVFLFKYRTTKSNFKSKAEVAAEV